MEFKKCVRCGNFFANVQSDTICGNCMQKENLDISKLKNYIDDIDEPIENMDFEDNIDDISYATGIMPKNLSRQLQNDIIFKDLNTNL